LLSLLLADAVEGPPATDEAGVRRSPSIEHRGWEERGPSVLPRRARKLAAWDSSASSRANVCLPWADLAGGAAPGDLGDDHLG
jgi:hypothetical protein